MTAASELTALMSGTPAARWQRSTTGELRLVYDTGYASDPHATPLSLSMPLTGRPYGHKPVSRWISSLLPDHPTVRRRWQEAHNTSDAFGVLATRVGYDCAGAVQFCPPERIADPSERDAGMIVLPDDQIEAEIVEMTQDPLRWTGDGVEPYFSLAGYQNKLALHRVDGCWARPFGRVPTTHILKPRHRGTATAAVVEHLCAAMARRLGLGAASTRV